MSYWDAQKFNIVFKCGGRGGPGAEYSNDHLSYSPELLLRINEEHDHNQTLPIAEYDDFNTDEGSSTSRSLDGRSRSGGDGGPATSFQNHNHLSYPFEEPDHHHNHHNYERRPQQQQQQQFNGPYLNDHHHDTTRGGHFQSDHGGGDGAFHRPSGNINSNDNGEPFYSTDDDIYDF